jgi:hypothetical protein
VGNYFRTRSKLLLNKALQNWKFFVNSYRIEMIFNYNDYNETIMTIITTEFPS